MVMNSLRNLTRLLQEPDALRGLDHLIERARCVLERYMDLPLQMPVRIRDHQQLARTA